MAETKELDLFTPKHKITDIVNTQWIDYRTVAAVNDGCCMEFDIPASSLHYIDLDHSLLKLKVGLSKANGTAVLAADNVGLTNGVLNSVFSQVDITFNELNISPDAGSNHAYRAFLDVLLDESGRNSTGERLECEGYVKVMFAGEEDYGNNNAALGLNVDNGKTLTVVGKLRTDAFSLGKYIPNGVAIKVKLYQSSDAFRITAKAAGVYKLTIEEAVLKVCQVKLSAEELLKQDESFSKSPAKIDYIRSDVRAFQIPTGSYSATFENLYGGRVPLEVIAGLVSAAGYSGKMEKNPLRFQHYNLNRIAVTIDGVSVPRPAFKPNFPQTDWCECFLSLFKKGNHTDVLRGLYINQQCLYRFDLESYLDEESVPIQKSGNVRITLSFSEPLPEGATLIVYSKFADRFLIDRERNVFQDEVTAPFRSAHY